MYLHGLSNSTETKQHSTYGIHWRWNRCLLGCGGGRQSPSAATPTLGSASASRGCLPCLPATSLRWAPPTLGMWCGRNRLRAGRQAPATRAAGAHRRAPGRQAIATFTEQASGGGDWAKARGGIWRVLKKTTNYYFILLGQSQWVSSGSCIFIRASCQ